MADDAKADDAIDEHPVENAPQADAPADAPLTAAPAMTESSIVTEAATSSVQAATASEETPHSTARDSTSQIGEPTKDAEVTKETEPSTLQSASGKPGKVDESKETEQIEQPTTDEHKVEVGSRELDTKEPKGLQTHEPKADGLNTEEAKDPMAEELKKPKVEEPQEPKTEASQEPKEPSTEMKPSETKADADEKAKPEVKADEGPIRRNTNVAALAAGLKIPMPGARPPPMPKAAAPFATPQSPVDPAKIPLPVALPGTVKSPLPVPTKTPPPPGAVATAEEPSSAASFDTPLTDIRPLPSIHKHKSQLAPKNRRAPSRACKVYCIRGYKSLAPQPNDTVADAMKAVLEKSDDADEAERMALDEYGLFIFGNDGTETQLAQDRAMSEVTAELTTNDRRLFFRKLTEPTVKVARPDLFEPLPSPKPTDSPVTKSVPKPVESSTPAAASATTLPQQPKEAKSPEPKADVEAKRKADVEEQKRVAAAAKAEVEEQKRAALAAKAKQAVHLNGVEVVPVVAGTAIKATINGKPAKGFPLDIASILSIRVDLDEAAGTGVVTIIAMRHDKPNKSQAVSYAFRFGDAVKARAFYDEIKPSAPAPVPPRSLTVIVNAQAGKRKAVKILDKYVRPVLEALSFPVAVHHTWPEQSASAIVAGLDLSTTTGIILIGGDGLVHETLNGLASRPDWETATKVPIAIVSAGWRNTIAHAIYPPVRVRNAAVCTLAAAKGSTVEFDGCSLVRAAAPRSFSFGQEYGYELVASQQTEALRFIGSRRLMLGMITLGRRHFAGRLYYDPVEEINVHGAESYGAVKERLRSSTIPTASPPPQDVPLADKSALTTDADSPKEVPADAANEGAEQRPASAPADAPKETGNDAQPAATAVTPPAAVMDATTSSTSDSTDSSPSDAPAPSPSNTTTSEAPTALPTAPQPTPATTANSPSSGATPGPATTYGKLEDDVPDHWKVVEGGFAILRAGKLPLGGSRKRHSNALQDGAVNLTFVRIGAGGPVTAFKAFQRYETGQLTSEAAKVETVRAKAYRFEPGADGEFVSSDGERLPCAPFQVEVHPKLFTVLGVDNPLA